MDDGGSKKLRQSFSDRLPPKIKYVLESRSTKVSPSTSSKIIADSNANQSPHLLKPTNESTPFQKSTNEEPPFSKGANESLDTRRSLSNESCEEVCRICHESNESSPFITPCYCKGTMGMIHQNCLERWLEESGKQKCEICGYSYLTQRIPKHKGCASVWNWVRHPVNSNDTKNLFFDIACFFILTPLASISAWLCIVGAQHYSLNNDKKTTPQILTVKNHNYKLEESSNSTWTSVGLLTLTGTLLTAYYVWLFVAFRYHYQIWRDWSSRNFIVKVLPIPPEETGQNYRDIPQNNNAQQEVLNENSNNNETILSTKSSSSDTVLNIPTEDPSPSPLLQNLNI